MICSGGGLRVEQDALPIFAGREDDAKGAR
jgi:hypothetical protein